MCLGLILDQTRKNPDLLGVAEGAFNALIALHDETKPVIPTPPADTPRRSPHQQKSSAKGIASVAASKQLAEDAGLPSEVVQHPSTKIFYAQLRHLLRDDMSIEDEDEVARIKAEMMKAYTAARASRPNAPGAMQKGDNTLQKLAADQRLRDMMENETEGATYPTCEFCGRAFRVPKGCKLYERHKPYRCLGRKGKVGANTVGSAKQREKTIERRDSGKRAAKHAANRAKRGGGMPTARPASCIAKKPKKVATKPKKKDAAPATCVERATPRRASKKARSMSMSM